MPKNTDDAIASANDEALKELHDGAKEDEDQPEHEVVEPQDPDEVEETGKEPVRGQEKRRNRYREQQERAAAAERERDELRARLLAAEAAQRYAPQPSGPQAEPRDEHEERIKKLKEDQESCVKTFQAISGDSEQAQTAREAQRQRYMAIQDDIQRTLVDQAVHKRGLQPPMDPQKAIRLEMIRQRYADVVDHPTLAGHMLTYANGRWEQERALLRHQYGRDIEVPQNTMDAIFDETRRRFGVAKSPTPSAQVKARFQGSAVGARASNGAPQVSEKKSYPMNKQYLRMARAAHPGKSDKVAFQLWVNDQNAD